MTRAADVALLTAAADTIGEGPVWRPETGTLLRLDIPIPAVIELDPETGAETRFPVEAPVGFAIPRRAGGFVAGVGRAVVLFDGPPGTDGTVVAEVPEPAENRFNDAFCDPWGRLWAGTIGRGGARTAALYRLEPGGLPEPVLTNVAISNGLDLSPDGTILYYVDSATGCIDTVEFAGASGTLGARRPFVSIDPADGGPDGLCVDAEGHVWVALFGGGAIRRYRPDGTLDRHVPLPVTNPTSLAFGGPGLADMFVTSARVALSPEELAVEPAGAVLRLRPGVRGRTPNAYGG